MSADMTGVMAQGQPQPERVVARLRPHARALFWPSVALLVVLWLGIFYYGKLPEQWENLGVLIAMALGIILLWVIPLFSWLGRKYTITTRRIVLRSGFLVRVRQELLHSRGYDVTVRKNSLQSMFGSGNVQINTGLEHPVVLRDVPNAELVQAALHDLMEASQSAVATHRQQEASRAPDETTIWGTR
jgi:membrane protein YdbS with pleckstrin-like domain